MKRAALACQRRYRAECARIVLLLKRKGCNRASSIRASLHLQSIATPPLSLTAVAAIVAAADAAADVARG
jgi:hypothetical protein